MVLLKLEISESNLLKLKDKTKNLGFDKIQDYLTYVIEQSISEEEDEQEVSEEDEEAVKKRLKELGYL